MAQRALDRGTRAAIAAEATTATGGGDERLMGSLAAVAVDPVFILGSARSGTTLLYELLQQTGRFHVVELYHLMEYDRLLAHHAAGTEEAARATIDNRLAEAGVTDRGIDGVKLSSRSPIEYFFRFWEGVGALRLVLPSTSLVQPSTLSSLAELCRKVRVISGSEKPVLLKSPLDFPNFLRIKELLPQSKFLFIHRHPLRAVTSQQAAMRSLLGTYNPGLAMLTPVYQRLYQRNRLRGALLRLTSSRLGVWLLARYYAKTVRRYVRDLAALPAADYLSLRYEDLCNAPQEAIDQILKLVQLTPTEPLGLAERIKLRASSVSPQVRRALERRRAQLAEYLDGQGYRLEEG